MVNEKRMLTLREVSEQLNVSRRTIERYIAKGLITAVKYDKAIRIAQSEIERFKMDRRIIAHETK